MIELVSKKKFNKTILREYPDATIVDVTSKAQDDCIKFSPFYPHGNIPVPGMDGYFSACVEGIWQGLKVFEHEGVDLELFKNDKMKGLLRTEKKHGKVVGHQYEGRLLGYAEAQEKIYIPVYNYVLEHYCQDLLKRLKEISDKGTLVLRDYVFNNNLTDLNISISHAALIKLYIENKM